MKRLTRFLWLSGLWLWGFGLLGACAGWGPGGDDPAEDENKAAKTAAQPKGGRPKTVKLAQPAKATLPNGFVARGQPEVQPAYLAPAASWRDLRARLTTVQADARRRGRDILVSFGERAVHVTRRDGSQTTWLLPAGLELEILAPHVVVRQNLTLEAFSADGKPVPAADEIPIAVARWAASGGGRTESRLAVKGGRAFRSMTTE
ncbi:MAG: hypothetical protein ACYTGZ_22935 [Planctomycetota bacterium]|jgi:hypothetical protein